MSALIEVNTDGLAKLADTVGGWFGWNANAVERMAEAEAYATVRKVDAENAAALARLQGEDQVAQYLLAREARRMNNVQQVVEKTQSMFAEGEQVSNEPVNPDWVNRFISIVEDISDDEMQKLWARILAGEIKQPKSYSLRTLELLRNITKDDAENIVRLAKFAISDDRLCSEEDFAMKLNDQILMDDIGMICGEECVRTYHISERQPYSIVIDKNTIITMYVNANIDVKIKYYKMSKAGREILKLIPFDKRDDFVANLANHLKKQGVERITKNNIISWDGSQYTYIPNAAVEI